jgi:hypothetical protein
MSHECLGLLLWRIELGGLGVARQSDHCEFGLSQNVYIFGRIVTVVDGVDRSVTVSKMEGGLIIIGTTFPCCNHR